MPSKSPAQHRLMEAAAHTAGGYGGVSQSVGKEFVAKDIARVGDRRVHLHVHDVAYNRLAYGDYAVVPSFDV